MGEEGGGNWGGEAVPSSPSPRPPSHHMSAIAWKRKRIEIDLTQNNFPKVLIVYVV